MRWVPVMVVLGLLATGAVARAVEAPAGDSAAATQQPCYGAAAVTQSTGACAGSQDRLDVYPDPRSAKELKNSPCVAIADALKICSFGVEPAQARQTVGLVGDSHSGQWRFAMDQVAKAQGWTGVQIGHASCPLSKAPRDLPALKRINCTRWRDQVFAWFAQHPEVTTIFVGGLSGGPLVVAKKEDKFETAVKGYQDAWAALPPTVQHIVVLRDTPKQHTNTPRCIELSQELGIPPGPQCALTRQQALDPDPQTTAAYRLHSPRVQVLDMTRYFCDKAKCYPVIGGALVLKDATHMTGAFSASLGPILLDRVRALSSGWVTTPYVTPTPAPTPRPLIPGIG